MIYVLTFLLFLASMFSLYTLFWLVLQILLPLWWDPLLLLHYYPRELSFIGDLLLALYSSLQVKGFKAADFLRAGAASLTECFLGG